MNLLYKNLLCPNKTMKIQTKICSKCGKSYFAITEYFYKNNSATDRLSYRCKNCLKEDSNIYRKSNSLKVKAYKKKNYLKYRQKILKNAKVYRQNHKEALRKYNKKYIINHKKEAKEYYNVNREKIRKSHKKLWKQYYQKHAIAIKEKQRKWRNENREKINKQRREYCQKNRDRLIAAAKKWRQEHKDEIRNSRREYNQKNKERIIESNRSYREKNRVKIKEYFYKNKEKIREYYRNKLKTDVSYRILHNLRERLRMTIKSQNAKKSDHTLNLIGCSIKNLIKHIESQFDSEMSWDNYGYKGWHIDHIKPCAAFDLTKEKEQRKCFNYKNLRPLWWPDNLKKNSFYKGKYIRKRRSLCPL